MNDGNFANAAMSYHHALEHDNSVPGYYLALSECLRRLGNHEGADRLTRLAAQVPAQLARYEGQATSSPTAAPEPDAESPKPGSGATSMPSGTFMPPNNSEAAAIAKKARRLLEQKDFVSAARQYHMALKIDHTNPDYYKDLSECQSRLSNDELAIQLAREAIRIGGRAEDYSQLGNAFYYKGDYESALAEYVTAAKLSGHGLHYAHIAGVLIKLGDLETARKFAAAAKQLGCKEHWSFKRLRITNQSQSDARNVAPCSD